jgi:hypothetical protein
MIAGEATLWLAARQVQPASHFVGPDAATFAAGSRRLLDLQPEGARVPCGSIGDEYLLIAEPGTWHRQVQSPAAATTATVLPFLVLTANQSALGDELFQAGALLDQEDAADALPLMAPTRLLLLLAILALAALRLLPTT